MILRAEPIGKQPSLRFVIRNMHDDSLWDGDSFEHDFDQARKYACPSDACAGMQEILKVEYDQLPLQRYAVPVEIEVFGRVSKRDIAKYLHRASVLCIRTEEYGNGPGESLVLTAIHWGLIKEVKHSVLDKEHKPGNPDSDWGLEKKDEDK